jgi:hypothetical protein
VVGNKGNWNKLDSSLFPQFSSKPFYPNLISFLHVEEFYTEDRCWVVISWSEDLLGSKEALEKTREISGQTTASTGNFSLRWVLF